MDTNLNAQEQQVNSLTMILKHKLHNSYLKNQIQRASYNSYILSTYDPNICEALYRGEQNRAMVIYEERMLMMRPKLIRLIKSIYFNHNLERSTLHLAVYILDVVITKIHLHVSDFELVAIVCIMAVAKMEDAKILLPSFMSLNAMVDNKYNLQQYRNMEMAVLGAFNFRLLTPTVATFVDHYANNVITLKDYHDYMQLRNKVIHSRLSPTISMPFYATYTDMLAKLKQILYAMTDVTLNTYTLSNARPSILASACMLSVRRMHMIFPDWSDYMLHITQYEAETLLGFVPLLIDLYLQNAPVEMQDTMFEPNVREAVIALIAELPAHGQLVENLQPFGINEQFAQDPALAVAAISEAQNRLYCEDPIITIGLGRYRVPAFQTWVPNLNPMYGLNSQADSSEHLSEQDTQEVTQGMPARNEMGMEGGNVNAASTPMLQEQQRERTNANAVTSTATSASAPACNHACDHASRDPLPLQPQNTDDVDVDDDNELRLLYLRPAQPSVLVRSRSTQTTPTPSPVQQPIPTPINETRSFFQQDRRRLPNAAQRVENIAMVAPRIRAEHNYNSMEEEGALHDRSANYFTDSGLHSRSIDYDSLTVQELSSESSDLEHDDDVGEQEQRRSAEPAGGPYTETPTRRRLVMDDEIIPSDLMIQNLLINISAEIRRTEQAQAQERAAAAAAEEQPPSEISCPESFVDDDYEADNEDDIMATPACVVEIVEGTTSNHVIVIDNDEDESADELRDERRDSGRNNDNSDESEGPASGQSSHNNRSDGGPPRKKFRHN